MEAKVHKLMVGVFFVVGAAIGVSTVQAAPKSLAGQQVIATEEDEETANCYKLLTVPRCIVDITHNCVCSISGTDGELGDGGDGSATAPQVPSYLPLQY